MTTVIDVYNDENEIVIGLKLHDTGDSCRLKKRIAHTYDIFKILETKDIISIGIKHKLFCIQIWNCKAPQSFIESYSYKFFKKLLLIKNVPYDDIEQTIDDIIFDYNVHGLEIGVDLDNILLNIFNEFIDDNKRTINVHNLTPINNDKTCMVFKRIESPLKKINNT